MRRSPLTLALLLTGIGCGAPPSAVPPSPAEPIGSSAYETRLLAASGISLSIEQQVLLAQHQRQLVEEELAALAGLLHPEGDWRQVWRELRADHPADRDELLDTYRREVARAAAFVAERRLAPLPEATVAVTEVGNAIIRERFPLALYLGGRLGVVASDETLARHCRTCIPPLVVHEAFPGHHVGMQYLPPNSARASQWSFFLEGWAQYAELLMLENGYYEGPTSQFGAWMLIHLRTLRAEIDARLHGGRISQTEAIEIYQQVGLLDRGAAVTEVTRHLTDPTLKASYLLGALQLLELRRLVLARQPDLALIDLHRELLRQPGTWPEIARAAFAIELAGLGSLAPEEPSPSAAMVVASSP